MNTLSKGLDNRYRGLRQVSTVPACMLLVISALHHLLALRIKKKGACIAKARLSTEARDDFQQAPVHFQLLINGALLAGPLALGVSLFTSG